MKKTNPANAETPEASTASVATGQMAHTPLPWKAVQEGSHRPGIFNNEGVEAVILFRL